MQGGRRPSDAATETLIGGDPSEHWIRTRASRPGRQHPDPVRLRRRGSHPQSVSGIAAEGLAIANAAVTVKDAVGNTRSVTTDARGNYTIDTAGLTFPLMLQVTGNKGVWYALVTEDDRGRQANINNATNSIALLALGAASGTELQAAFAAGSFKSVSAATVANADSRLLDALEAELGKRPASLRSARFTPGTADAEGDETDRLLTLVHACPSGGGFGTYNAMPEHVWADTYTTRTYDGVSDDLLTAGYGKSGLAAATTPIYGNAAELRRYAIHTNYRALVDGSTRPPAASAPCTAPTST